ncbi:FkbM family methyltransferase [Altererythrobacter aurantiacus]|uniref:FkbM family methyltransferase n=1 Tax=Parapontixanthobacter aurantiacus TaxID=1463599 RepID=A0A844ZGW5_9SPHN|nr:FkbM family methyltransferase [Parapontixanthobacter aurantiacus]MXO86784.1 FkbM family methyltransferase [Parapontixanthobacter aurantiacus]
MRKNWREYKRRRDAQTAFRYLHEQREEFLAKYPQMCCLSFDHISIVLNVLGRMDEGQLEWFDSCFGSYLADKVVCDVGANLGNHSLFFAGISDKVLSFEPNTIIYELLAINARAMPNISVNNVGISNEARTVQAAMKRSAYGSARITDSPEDDELPFSFETRPLDSFEAVQSSDVGLIKIDVEGHEAQAIEGAENTIRRTMPLILFEQNSDAIEEGTSVSLEMLRSFGYKKFVEPVTAPSGRLSDKLSGRVARLSRGVEALMQGPPEKIWEAREIASLSARHYPWIVAIPPALELLEA